MARSRDSLRIGVGASFADDRIDPATDLAERGDLDYLVFDVWPNAPSRART
jgi:hypothetical protein